MIIAWQYNELWEDIDATRTGNILLNFPRPGTSLSRHKILIDKEVMFGDTWSGFTDLTPVQVAGPGGLGLRRGRLGTQAAAHKAKTPAWIEWKPSIADYNTVSDLSQIGVSLLGSSRINALLPDGNGGAIMGGNFSITAGGGAASHLARVKPDKTADPLLAPSINAQVRDIEYSPDNNILYVVGDFTSYDSTSVGYAVAIDAQTGTLIHDFDFDDIVRKVHVSGNRVFFGGDFTDTGGISRGKFASFTRGDSDWTLDDFDLNANNDVYDIYTEDDFIYVAGAFTSIVGESRNYLVRVDSDTGSLDDWDPDPDAAIDYIENVGDYIYVGGAITDISGKSVTNVARFNSSLSVDTDWDPQPNGAVYKVSELSDNKLLIAGAFTQVSGDSRGRAGIVSSIDGDLFSADPNYDDDVYDIALTNGELWIGGEFTNPLIIDVIEASYSFSPIGRYNFEGVINLARGDRILSAQWSIYKNDSLFYQSVEQNEFKVELDGIHIQGPDITLPDPIAGYRVELLVTKASGEELHTIGFGGNTEETVYFIPDGTETGDPYNEDSVFAAPTIVAATGTYTITLPDQTNSPSMTNDTYFYRVFAILEGGMDKITVEWGGTSEDINVPLTTFYTTRVYSNANSSSFSLDCTIENTNTGHDLDKTLDGTHPAGQQNTVNPDQMQIERQVRIGGSLVGHQRTKWVSDWVPTDFSPAYTNQGPSAWEYRYRVRYRDFRRDGIDDERGPIEVISNWSAWSSWT